MLLGLKIMEVGWKESEIKNLTLGLPSQQQGSVEWDMEQRNEWK